MQRQGSASNLAGERTGGFVHLSQRTAAPGWAGTGARRWGTWLSGAAGAGGHQSLEVGAVDFGPVRQLFQLEVAEHEHFGELWCRGAARVREARGEKPVARGSEARDRAETDTPGEHHLNISGASRKVVGAALLMGDLVGHGNDGVLE